MKQTNWQRLATIGLCSSLMLNAFSGVTAVAETVTIESSPTAESVKEESTPASTEASEATTDTSQEATEETIKETEEQEETVINDQLLPDVELPNLSNKASVISPRAGQDSTIYPRIQMEFVDELGAPFTEKLSLNGKYTEYARRRDNGSFQRTTVSAPIISSQATTNKYNVFTQTGVTVTANIGEGNYPTSAYYLRGYFLDTLSIANTLKYVDKIEFIPKLMYTVKYDAGKVALGPPVEVTAVNASVVDREFKKNAQNLFSITSILGTTNTNMSNILAVNTTGAANDSTKVNLVGFDGTATYKETLSYKVTRKQVTEKFVNTSGAAITPPSGFSQNKQTPMTSNAFTFKQSGTLPDTYAAGGKTYKFKGWYKGKTKPATLTTTKAPSYAVTYDGNDDLNVVYEEIATFDFPESTYQFGFINEAGQLVNPADITITYDHKSIAYRGTGAAGSTVSFGTIATNQSGSTVGKLKEVTFPATRIDQPTETGWNGEAFSNFSIKLPRYYQSLNLYDTTGKINPNYPLPTITVINSVGANTARPEAAVIDSLTLTQRSDKSYTPKENYSTVDPSVKYPQFLRRFVNSSNLASGNSDYWNVGSPIYYHLTNRKVTEAFVDSDGTKITPPTGFTQGKQTVITNDAYTFKQSGTLPDSYTVDGKTYKFKGWYKGKTKPATLQTTKAPSYAVTYDDNDDLNVVYEELIPKDTWVYPGFHADFVDEKGQAFNEPLTFSGNYTQTLRKAVDQTYVTTGAMNPLVSIKNTNEANVYTITTQSRVNVPANFDEVPSDIYDIRSYAINDWNITTELKYVDKIETMNTTLPVSVYPVGFVGTDPVFNNSAPSQLNELDKSFKKGVDNKFSIKATFGVGSSINTIPRLLFIARATGNPENKIVLAGFDGTQDFKQTMNYKVTRKQVTEKFVDANGVAITPPTGFTQGNQVPMTSNTFKYTAAKALPTTYTAGGKTYTFQGWYKGKTKPTDLAKTTTPTFATTFDGNDDMTAVYQEAVPTAELTLKSSVDVVETGETLDHWAALLKNTGQAPLTTIKIKPTAEWSAGISVPNTIFVQGTGQNTKAFPVTKEQWTTGGGIAITLDQPLPVGGQLIMNLLGTTVTGVPGQVLTAEVEVTGNFGSLTAKDTVRIKDLDQVITNPDEEGFISVPTFDFGQVGISGSRQQHGLKKTANYYGNGTRNPFVRIKKTQPNWSLTAQLSQPKSAKDSLSTATRLLLGQAPVASFSNYNLPTELKNPVGTTSAISLNANDTATSIIANQQFTGSDIYQLDFVFNNVKLEVPANQGLKGQQYTANVTWNLVTGP